MRRRLGLVRCTVCGWRLLDWWLGRVRDGYCLGPCTWDRQPLDTESST